MSVAVALGLLAVLASTPARSAFPSPGTSQPITLTDSTPILFAHARALARSGQSALAFASYLRGMQVARSAAAWALYRSDLALLASQTELTVWDHASPAERPALMRAFWVDRDTRDGLPVGGRLVEHVRRLDLAMEQYRIHPRRGRTPITRTSSADVNRSSLRDYIPIQGELDDRGVIFVRQGAPDARVVSSSPSIESWVYRRADANLVVHFAETLFDGSSGNSVLVAVVPPSTFVALCDVDQESCRLGARGSAASPEMREHFRQRSLAAIKALTTTDHATPSTP